MSFVFNSDFNAIFNRQDNSQETNSSKKRKGYGYFPELSPSSESPLLINKKKAKTDAKLGKIGIKSLSLSVSSSSSQPSTPVKTFQNVTSSATPERSPLSPISSNVNRKLFDMSLPSSVKDHEVKAMHEESWKTMSEKRAKLESSGIREVNEKPMITINKIQYELKFIGSGDYHLVYGFLPKQPPISLNGQTIPVESVVLRCASANAKRAQLGTRQAGVTRIHTEEDLREYRSDFRGFLYLRDSKFINIPFVYHWPENPASLESLYDLKDGNFWLVQKIEQRVSIQGWAKGQKFEDLDQDSKDLLLFVKKILTEQARTKRDVVHDFHPRNVMKDLKGQFYMIDFAGPDNEDWDLFLTEELRDWSNNNPHIWAFLISDFPEGEKENFEQFQPPKGFASSEQFQPVIPGLEGMDFGS